MSQQPPLRRAMGGFDATTVGIGAMIGAGAFIVLAPAAAAAGALLPLAIVIAGVVAYCNASATASLAVRYPSSGGTYVYGREQLGHWPGFLAGWSFVTGKLASCAAMALTFGLYAAPGAGKAAAVAAVVGLTVVNLLGVTRTAIATRVIVSLVVPVIAFVIVVAFSAPPVQDTGAVAPGGAGGVLQASALLFFAFAGYARIATMGEEVRNPRRNIPLAILGALGFTLVLYLLLGVSLLRALGPAGLAEATAPLRDVFDAAVPGEGSMGRGGAVVTLAAALASLGALLALIAGVGRTGLAMARGGDLPRVLARVSRRYGVPWVADIATAVVVVVLLLTTDVLTVVGFSSFGVLLYYAIANIAAFTLPERQWYAPRWLNAIGALACLVLAFTLPTTSVVTMLVVLGVGLAGRAAVLARRRVRG
ncbi:amino acid permease [Arthrobacter agilis]|uniref:APC family permease n=1 Tax=Arthrobacter agilis TaxID=37921 RepID=UPI000B364146|nr:APC family permease [Arthrobacter agilis]OUM44585.1 amino acid permease [Arthrobacter agilis]PPB47563.1 amino acid permease [Arthrobacter agilis]TPV22721.1 amino acid permease [Arthrobacter agilis]VDR31962.1 Serine/threonine exchanger SteT [Arthrobacter agilis]